MPKSTDVDEALEHRRHDPAAAGRAERQDRAALRFEHDRRGGRPEDALAGLDRVEGAGLGLNQVMPLFSMTPVPLRHDGAAEKLAEGGGERHDVAVSVHHGQVGGAGVDASPPGRSATSRRPPGS